MDRPGAVHRDATCLRQYRRRHLHPFRPAGDPRRGRRQGQHHLQAAVQRRRRDDRRPAARRRPDRAGVVRASSPPKASAGSSSSATSPTNTRSALDFAAGATVRHRDDLDAVQRELREIAGVTAIVYDQTCAAEKRRRRKRGRFPDPPQRVFINDLVCEGCGDCSKTSNCLSVVPVETEFGRKRAIDQSSCNKDYLLPQGLLPEFCHGAGRHAAQAQGGAKSREDGLPPLPEPGPAGARRALRHPRHRRRRHRRRDDRRAARHGGASRRQGRHRARHDRHGAEGRRGAAAMSASPASPTNDPCRAHRRRRRAAAARLRPRRRRPAPRPCRSCSRGTAAPSSTATRRSPAISPATPTSPFPGRDAAPQHRRRDRPDGAEFIDATRLATGLLGDSIATNLFMLGYAYQQGLVPVSAEAIERAIELNGGRGRVQPQRLSLGPARRDRPAACRGAGRRRRRRHRQATACPKRSTR